MTTHFPLHVFLLAPFRKSRTYGERVIIANDDGDECTYASMAIR